ncbi:hypothetical protein Hanom_Chr05g00426241 [Helianthus anomalus]
MDGYSKPVVVLRQVVVCLLGVCFCGCGLENVASGGLLCLNDFLLFEVPSSFVLISQCFNSFYVAEDLFSGSGFCLGVGLPKFFMLCFSPFLALSSSFSKTGAGVVPVKFTRASLMPLISACVSLYLTSTITLISSICVLC